MAFRRVGEFDSERSGGAIVIGDGGCRRFVDHEAWLHHGEGAWH